MRQSTVSPYWISAGLKSPGEVQLYSNQHVTLSGSLGLLEPVSLSKR